MSELQNPLFDEEKEFLERKKLEYERALRGDVEHIKDQSVKVGKVALVGAGLAGGIWLITKAFSSKKHKRGYSAEDGDDREESADDYLDHDHESDAEYFTSGNGKRYKSTSYYGSAADSANAFMKHGFTGDEASDQNFGAAGTAHAAEAAKTTSGTSHYEPSLHDTEDFEDDPFKDLPYDDSRRLYASHAFDDEAAPMPTKRADSTTRMIGTVLTSFLQSDTGKVLVGQVAAVTLALVTKKVSEFFPAAKNSDLATSPGYAPAATGADPVAPPASPTSLDASTQPQSL